MIVGNGSASWQIIRDLAMRLPAMVLPSWTASRTCPVAIEDVVVALVRGLDIPLPRGAWYDIPGLETLSGRDMLLQLAALHGRRVPSVRVPFLSVSLSSWWLKLVARTDFSLAREIVLGFTGDLLPADDRYWNEVGYRPKWTFEAAARQALEGETTSPTLRGVAGRLGESMVQLVSPKVDKHAEASH
jgi:nucleoside-diphosphate-sugar epimerase